MQRIRLHDTARLPDGSVATIKDALGDGRLKKQPIWQAQWNRNAGNVLGYAPSWKTDPHFFSAVERALRYLRDQGRGDHAACRLVRRLVVATPDHRRDYGFVGQTVLASDALDREVRTYGTEGYRTADEVFAATTGAQLDRAYETEAV